jgi:hypothetical protein
VNRRTTKVPAPIGTVLEFQVPGGHRYVQLSAQVSAPHAPSYRMTWSRVLPGLFVDPATDLGAVVAQAENFHVLLDYADKLPILEGVRLAGAALVPPDRAIPRVTRALAHPVGNRTRWRIEGPGDAERVVWSDQLSDTDAEIPLGYLETMDRLQRILEIGWWPRRSIFSSRIEDTPSIREAEQAFAAKRRESFDFEVALPEQRARAFQDALSGHYPDLSIERSDSDEDGEHLMVIGYGLDRRPTIRDFLEKLATANGGEVIHSGTYVGQRWVRTA